MGDSKGPRGLLSKASPCVDWEFQLLNDRGSFFQSDWKKNPGALCWMLFMVWLYGTLDDGGYCGSLYISHLSQWLNAVSRTPSPLKNCSYIKQVLDYNGHSGLGVPLL